MKSCAMPEPTFRRHMPILRRSPANTSEAHAALEKLGSLRSPIAHGLTSVDHRSIIIDALDNYCTLAEAHHDYWRPANEAARRRVHDDLATSLGATVLAAARLEKPKPWARDFNEAMAGLTRRAKTIPGLLTSEGQLPITLGTYQSDVFQFAYDGTLNPHLFRLYAGGFHLGSLAMPATAYLPSAHFKTPLSVLLIKGARFEEKWGINSPVNKLALMRDGVIDGITLFETLAHVLCATPDTQYVKLAPALLTLLDLMDSYLQITHAKQKDTSVANWLLEQLNQLLSNLGTDVNAKTIRFVFRQIVASKAKPEMWVNRLQGWGINVQALMDTTPGRIVKP